MKYFLGVTNRDKWLKLKPSQKSFWCVYNSYKPNSGDILFLHRTQKGVCQVYTILSEPYKSNEVDCSIRGMSTIDIELIANLKNLVTAQDIRSNPILSKSGAVGRNFQSTIFELTSIQGEELEKIIKSMNPSVLY